MPFEENPKSCGERIDSAYNRFCEAWHNGERLDPAEYCAEHSESGPELLDRINNFLFVMEGCLDESPGCDLAGDQERGAANGPRVLGEFTLLREIGRGGMGVVYEAEQASLRRRVALKVLPRHLTLARGAIRKFRREAEAGGRQNHPGIVTTYALGEEDGIHFIAQELVEGSDTLAARIESLRKGGQVPLGYFREAATLVARVAEAIEHAHASGVIHRDIKPSNILITRQGDPKVSDFGLAKVEDALALSRTGDFSGTPYYMSPEQAASRRIGIDHRTDIFSLGVTLYEMLTLARPFDGETTQDVLKKILLDEPRDPRKVNPRLPNDLAVICLKAMEKKPEERYATMADFAGDLRRFLNGETILARPVGMVTKLRKRVQRNPALSGAVLVAGLSLLVLLVILPEMIRLQKSDEAIETLIREKKLTEMGQRLIGEAQVTSKEDGTLSLLLALYGARQILKVNPGPDYSLYNLLMRLMDEVREKKIISLGLISSGTLCPDFKKTAYSLIDGRLFILDIESKSKEEILVDPGFWPIRALAFSPDGNSLAVGTERGEIRVWSEDFQKWSEPMQAQSGAVRSLAFNPRDAHQLLIACKEPTALLWNFETQEKVLELKGHSGFLQSVVFSPDGGRIITASEDGTARIWDSASGDLLITLEHAAYVTCAGLSQDGKKAITGTSDGQVRLFDLETGAPPRILEKNHSALTCVGFNEGKDQLYAASSDGTLYVYEGTHLEEPDKFVGHKDAIVQAMAHSLGTEFMTLSLDGTLRVWSSMPMLRHSLTKLEEGVWDYDFDNCKDRLLRASNDKKTMEVWDVDKGEPVFSCRIDDAFTKKAILVPDRVPIEYVISDGGESFYPWNPETGERHQAIHLKKELFTKTVRLSPSGRYLFALPTYNNARLWDVDLNREVCIVLVHGDPRWLTFTPDESRLLIGASKGRAEIIDIKGEKFVNDKALQDWLDGPVAKVEFSPDGQYIMKVMNDGTACVSHANLSGEEIHLREDRDPIQDALFSPDGKSIVTWSRYGSAALWSIGSEVKRLTLPVKYPLKGATFSSDSSRVLTCDQYDNIQIWNTETGGEINESIRCDGDVMQVSFSRDDTSFCTRYRDKGARLWRTEDMSPILTIQEDLLDISFTHDSLDLIALLPTGQLKAWPSDPLEYAEQRVARNLTAEERRRFKIEGADSPATMGLAQDEKAAMDAVNLRCRHCLCRSNGDPADYILCYKLVKQINNRNPEELSYLKILGAAIYRLGYYDMAYANLRLCAKKDELNHEPADPLVCAFLSMCQCRLGNKESAHEYLALSRADSPSGRKEKRTEIASLQSEAESLLYRDFPEEKPMIKDPVGENAHRMHDPFLTVESSGDQHYSMLLYDPQSSGEVVLLDEEKPIHSLAINHDGSQLCYVEAQISDSGKEYHLIIRDILKTGTETRLSDPVICWKSSSQPFNDPAWHPNKDKIYFVAQSAIPHSRGYEIYYIDTHAGQNQEPHPLLSGVSQNFGHPSVSSDGKQMVFTHYPYHSWSFYQEIWIGETSEQGDRIHNLRQLTLNSGSDGTPGFTGDDASLIWVKQDSPLGPCHLMRRPVAGFFEGEDLANTVNHPEVSFVGLWSISRSGSIVFLERLPDHTISIHILDPDGSSRKVADCKGSVHALCYLH